MEEKSEAARKIYIFCFCRALSQKDERFSCAVRGVQDVPFKDAQLSKFCADPVQIGHREL
ncbi:MAG: hypothetical protein CMG96_00995 [Marinovum sp.]|nr:hypothetical protein [Marinovum sp.]